MNYNLRYVLIIFAVLIGGILYNDYVLIPEQENQWQLQFQVEAKYYTEYAETHSWLIITTGTFQPTGRGEFTQINGWNDPSILRSRLDTINTKNNESPIKMITFINIDHQQQRITLTKDDGKSTYIVLYYQPKGKWTG
jgi:hypothetical protein